MQSRKCRSLLAISFILSACSSAPQTARQQSVTIITPDAPGASCNIAGKHNLRSKVSKTPGTTSIKAGHGPLTIICKKDGFEDTVFHVKELTKKQPQTGGFFEELTSFAHDPFASIGTEYPQEIEIFMEPKKK